MDTPMAAETRSAAGREHIRPWHGSIPHRVHDFTWFSVEAPSARAARISATVTSGNRGPAGVSRGDCRGFHALPPVDPHQDSRCDPRNGSSPDVEPILQAAFGERPGPQQGLAVREKRARGPVECSSRDDHGFPVKSGGAAGSGDIERVIPQQAHTSVSVRHPASFAASLYHLTARVRGSIVVGLLTTTSLMSCTLAGSAAPAEPCEASVRPLARESRRVRAARQPVLRSSATPP